MATIKLSISQGRAIYRADLLRFLQDQAPLRTLELRLCSSEGVVFRPLRWLVDDQDHEDLADEIARLLASDAMSVEIATDLSAPAPAGIAALAPLQERAREVRKIPRVAERPAEPQRETVRRPWPLLGRLVAND